MIPALFTSASALQANQLLLSVVGNNLANSNTTGFKSQSLRFSDQFSQLLSGPSQPTTGNGGKNPIQLGLGVQVAATDTNLTQGTFQSTGNPLDLAIQDNGYFVLSNNGQTVFTRDGAFSVDSNNNLVNSATGAKVQRVGTVGEGNATTPAFQVSGTGDIKIPKGITIPGAATQNIGIAGNLNANSTGPLAQVLSSSQALTTKTGVFATKTTLLNDLAQTTTPYVDGDKITVSGTRADGTSVAAAFTYLTGTADTVDSLLTSINQAFLSGTVGTGALAAINASGKISVTANQTGPTNLSISLASSGTGVTNFTNFQTTTVGKAGYKSTQVVRIFDAQSAPHNLTLTFEKIAANRWDVKAALDPSEGSIKVFGQDNTVAGLSFNQDGSFLSVVGNSNAESQVTSNPFTVAGAPADSSTVLSTLDKSTSNSIQITGIDYNGKAVSTSLSVTAGVTTLGDLVNQINDPTSGFTGATASIDLSGNIQLTAKKSGQTALSLELTDASGSSLDKFVETTQGTTGDDKIAFQINNLAGYGQTQTVKLAFGTPNLTDGLSQYGTQTDAPSSTSVNQDGFAQGTLVSTNVSKDGTVTGQFSNGKQESIAQIALATFSNPEGLQRNGGNFLTSNTNSGLPIITSATTGGAGSIQSGALESSNVDVGSEFTQLIAAQRGYQVNAKAFGAASQMMQETIDLLR